MVWNLAPDISHRLRHLVNELKFIHVRADRIISFRSQGSTSRATARIWSLPRIWQQALNISPHYCLEVVSERFDKLTVDDQERVLIHELLHIPKTFSGALVPHRSHVHGRRTYKHYHDVVESLFRSLRLKSHEVRL